jgi:hypothetical protein
MTHTLKTTLNAHLRETMDLYTLVGVIAELARDIAADYEKPLGDLSWSNAAADLEELRAIWAIRLDRADERKRRG